MYYRCLPGSIHCNRQTVALRTAKQSLRLCHHSVQVEMGQNVSKLIDQYIAAGDPNIDLSGKHLSELPPEVERLAPLVVRLGLSQNLLSSLPVEVSRLGQLRYLNIRANHFREFPKAVCLRFWFGSFLIRDKMTSRWGFDGSYIC